MKKTFTLMLCITTFILAQATNYYVDPTNGVNTGRDGLSWATAVKDIGTAITLANNSSVDNIFVKQGTINITTQTYSTIDNIYGSCKGDETSPSQRPLTDLDGNGIVEPWEFQYPTVINSTNTTSSPALTMSLSGSTFNGFTIIHTGSTSVGGVVKTINCTDATMTFENNTIKNCVTNSTWTTGSVYGLLMTTKGTVKNCLFEKNHVTVISTASPNNALTPIMSVTAGSTVFGCVLRNNLATLDFSAATAATTSNLKGQIMNVEAGSGGIKTTIGNTLIYNNEAVYIPSTLTATLSGGATICLSAISSANCTDSIINCTIANNKTTKMLTGGLYSYKSGSLVSNIINNVFWNNQNYDGTTTFVKNINTNSSLSSGLVGYNVCNSGSQGLTATPTYVVNNLNNLDNENATASTGPQFVNPTNFAGSAINSADSVSIKQADWRLNSGSYLIGKGLSISGRTTDKVGNNFDAVPSVGAYEYVTILEIPVITWNQTITLTNLSGTLDLTATSTSSESPITYTSNNESVVTISGNVLTVTGEGEVTVTAHQAASVNYLAAANVSITFTVIHDTSTGFRSISNNNLIKTLNNGFISKTEGKLQLYSFNGSLIRSMNISIDQYVILSSGTYIVRISNKDKVEVQKIVIQNILR